MFEQALSALTHLPETRAMHEQAIDLRLALRTALYPSGDWRRILALLHDIETLAEVLNDPRRLAQVSLFLSVHCRYMGAYDQSYCCRSARPGTRHYQWGCRPTRTGKPAPRLSLPGPGRLSSGHRLPQADRAVTRRGAAPRAFGSNLSYPP